MAEMTIDDFTPSLLDAAATLFVVVFNAPPWSERWTEALARNRLNDVLATPGFAGVALHQGNDLCGFALGHVEQWSTGRHFQLQEMCVRTDRQRSGIGTALINALEVRLSGVEQLYLLTARESPAHRFYEHCGFRPARRQGVMLKRLVGTTQE